MSFLQDLLPARKQPMSMLERFMVGSGALYLGLGLGMIVATPQLLVLAARIDQHSWTDVGLARLLGLAIAVIGQLYIMGGRAGGTAFALGTVVERLIVMVLLAYLWTNGELPGVFTLLFCVLNLSLCAGVVAIWRWEASRLRGRTLKVSEESLPSSRSSSSGGLR